MATEKNIDFAAALKELNQLVEKMEQSDLSLEASLAHFESGIKLIRDCQGMLTKAEQKVTILTKDRDTLTEFDADE